MTIENLKKVLPPPLTPFNIGEPNEWKVLEDQLGVSLPSDYKSFIANYGSGYLGEFIWVFNPFVQSPNLNLMAMVHTLTEAYSSLKRENPDDYVHEVYPATGGILPWGRTDNGDELYWLTEGTSDEWPIIVYEARSSEFGEYSKTMSSFLYEVLSGRLMCEQFPEEFPKEFPGDSLEFVPKKI